MDQNFNPDKQHTISKSISISGTGLHTGVLVDMTLNPANPGFGYQFQRVDLPNQPIIKADCDLVTDTSRGTTLQVGEAKISTVEHILAALVGLGVDNVLIQVNGPEIPIIDGSSAPFIEKIEAAGVLEQDAAKAWYSIDENIFHTILLLGVLQILAFVVPVSDEQVEETVGQLFREAIGSKPLP